MQIEVAIEMVGQIASLPASSHPRVTNSLSPQTNDISESQPNNNKVMRSHYSIFPSSLFEDKSYALSSFSSRLLSCAIDAASSRFLRKRLLSTLVNTPFAFSHLVQMRALDDARDVGDRQLLQVVVAHHADVRVQRRELRSGTEGERTGRVAGALKKGR